MAYKTVGSLIKRLQKLDPKLPIYMATHADLDLHGLIFEGGYFVIIHKDHEQALTIKEWEETKPEDFNEGAKGMKGYRKAFMFFNQNQ